MIEICSYCRKVIGEKPPYEDKTYTHTVCTECATIILQQLEGISYDQYLDGFDNPILIVESSGRVVAANQQAANMAGKSTEVMVGFFGGEAMECQYARLEEGCGKTIHCPTCTIRNLVEKTKETKKTFEKVPVQLQTDQGTIEMVITTEYIEGLIKISIHGSP